MAISGRESSLFRFAQAPYPNPDVMYDTARPSSAWYCFHRCRESVMAAKNAYLVQERLYPLVQLSVGVVFSFGCIGLLGYGLLAIMGY
jgi:hypothetical protein